MIDHILFRRSFTRLFFLVFSLHAIADDSYASIDVRYFQTDERYEYRTQLLDLALFKTEKKWGAYNLVGIRKKITQARGSLLLEHGKGIDIASLATDFEREKKFLAIPIPILQGVLGYRVLLINREKRALFLRITSLGQLQKNYTAGFAEHWNDFKILKHNKLPVMNVPEYELFFPMLNANRFDYFPRGINEAWIEIEKYQTQFDQIIIEPNISLYYPFFVYFFTSRKNPALAERIQEGLEIALKDGSFKSLFLEYHQHLFKQAALEKRKMFFLENPSLPPIINRPRLEWWLPNSKSVGQ